MVLLVWGAERTKSSSPEVQNATDGTLFLAVDKRSCLERNAGMVETSCAALAARALPEIARSE